MEQVRFDIVTDKRAVQTLWNQFSPKSSLFDCWEYRDCFHKYTNEPLRFMVGYIKESLIGFLPLQWNAEKQHLEFFGSRKMNDNHVFIGAAYREYIPQFYGAIQEKALLETILPEMPPSTRFVFEDFLYTLPLAGIQSWEDYLQKYHSSTTRTKMRRKIKEIQKYNVQIVKNHVEDIELLFDYNIRHFKEGSTFHLPHRKEIFRDYLSLPFEIHLTTYVVDDKKVGISLSLQHNHIYYALNSGLDPDAHPDLATFMRMSNMENAIRSGATVFDAQLADCGWKELWHFDKSPRFTFRHE